MTTHYCTFQTLYGRPRQSSRPGETYNAMNISTARTLNAEVMEARTLDDFERIITERRIDYVWFACTSFPRHAVTVEVARERKLFQKWIRTWERVEREREVIYNKPTCKSETKQGDYELPEILL